MTPQTVLKINQLNKSYGSKRALININLEVKAGEKVALLGCNGAGKSTFINIATGLKYPSSGDVFVFNESSLLLSSKKKLAYLPQTLKFSGHLKVKDILKLVEAHFNSKIKDSILDRLELKPLLNRYCHGLSGGEERKLGLATCLIGNRPFLILDEPTANVDLVAKNEIHKILLETVAQESKALLFSSHEMAEVEKLADRVIVLNQGQIVAEGKVSEIKKSFGLMTVTFESQIESLNLNSSTKIEFFQNGIQSLLPNELKIKNNNFIKYKVYGPNSDQIITELVQKNIDFKNLVIEQTSLDDVFLKLWSQKT